MANPNNQIGTNAAYGGRTSPKAFNDVMAIFKGRGILSGWAVSPDSGLSIALGGNGTERDVAIAEDNAGNFTSVDNIASSPITFTMAVAPATQSRIDAVVVYIDNPPQGTSTATDNYGAVHILDVQGAVSSSPVKPNDSAIRTAITADGASGVTAYYVVLAYITIPNGTTTITSNLIEQGAGVEFDDALTEIADGAVTSAKLASNAVGTSKIADGAVTAVKITRDNINYGSTSGDIRIGVFNGKPLWRKVQTFSNLPIGYKANLFTTAISNLDTIVAVSGIIEYNNAGAYAPINYCVPDNVALYSTCVTTISAAGYASILGTGNSATNSGFVIVDYTTTS